MPVTDWKNVRLRWHTALQAVHEIMTKNDIRYWLDCGTLLCAVRDDSLVHEHDTDIGVFGEDIERVWSTRNEYSAYGFEMKRMGFHSHNFIYGILYDLENHNAHCMDMLLWYKILKTPQWRTCWGINLPFVMPTSYLETFETRTFFVSQGKPQELVVPSDPERHLAYEFGETEWRTPMTTEAYGKYQKDARAGAVEPYPVNRANLDAQQFWNDMKSYQLDSRTLYTKKAS